MEIVEVKLEDANNSPCDDVDDEVVKHEQRVLPIQDTLQMFTDSRLAPLELNPVQVENWLVIQRRRFDLRLYEEPFHAIRVLVDLDSGKFVHRIWGRTRENGHLSGIEDLIALLWSVFHQTVACLGFPHSSSFNSSTIQLEHPVSRQVSRDCLFTYQIDSGGENHNESAGIGLCANCASVKSAIEKPEEDSKYEQVQSVSNFKRKKRSRAKAKKEALVDEEEILATRPPRFFREAQKLYQSGSSIKQSSSNKKPTRRNSSKEGESDPDVCPIRLKRLSKVTVDSNVAVQMSQDKFKCPTCDKIFESEKMATKHRIFKHMFGAFFCHLCDFECRHADEYFNHVADEHEGEIKCPNCETALFEAVEGAKKDFCEHYGACLRIKREQLILEEDENSTVAEGDKRNYSCELCGKTFYPEYRLREHMNWHAGVKTYKCRECDFATHLYGSLYSHSKIHLREKGLTKFESDTLNSEVLLIFECDVEGCDKKYNSKDAMHAHKRKFHDGIVESVLCNVCGAVFTTRQSLRRHRNIEHPTNDRLRCDICGKRCGDTSVLRLHKRVHAEPEFVCKYCGKAVKSKQTLQTHERSHTGETPFKCKFCNYQSKCSSVLRKHFQVR